MPHTLQRGHWLLIALQAFILIWTAAFNLWHLLWLEPAVLLAVLIGSRR